MNFVYFTVPYSRVKYLGMEDDTVYFDDSFHLEDLVIYLGVFPSKSQARKNKWSGEIPRGQHEWKIGKRRFWTYRPVFATNLNNSLVQMYIMATPTRCLTGVEP